MLSLPAAAGGLAERLMGESRTAPALWPDADSPRLIRNLALPLPGATVTERAMAFTERYRDLWLAGDSQSELAIERVVDLPGGPVVQLSQRVGGRRGLGTGLNLSFGLSGDLESAASSLRSLAGLAVFSTSIEPEEAVRRVAGAVRSAAGELRGEPDAEPVWVVTAEGLAAGVRVRAPLARPLGDYEFLLLGPEGRIASFAPRLPMAQGYAYPKNPFRGNFETVTLPDLTSTEHLTGSYADVYNCSGSSTATCSAKQQRATPDNDGNYFIEPTGANQPSAADDTFGEVQGYYGINTIRAYFVNLGANPSPVKVGVNVPLDDNMGPNAFYTDREQSLGNGPAVMMGQWRNIDLAPDNDVIFHEYGHHVFGQMSSTGMFNMDEYGPVFWGLMFNEGAGDYFSCSALDDPSMGEYFASLLPMAFPDGYLRMLDNERTCPEGLYGEAHDDSMVWTGFLWEVRTLLGAATADPLYLAVIPKLPENADFPAATQLFLDEAAKVVDAPTLAQVRAIAERRGVDDCQRFIPLSKDGHTGFVYSRQILGQYANMLPFIPAELHYQIEVPAGATALEVRWTTFPTGLDVALLVRKDQPVQHSFSYMGGLTSTFDFKLTGGGGSYDLLQPSTAAPFEAGHTYYFQPANQDMTQPYAEYTILGSVTLPQCPDGQEPALLNGQVVCAPICEAGKERIVENDQFLCVPICGQGTERAKLDGQYVCAPICASGFERVIYEGAYDCAPLCDEGYMPEKKDGQWKCVSESSGGCGCSSAPASSLAMLLALPLMRRRRRG
jgi:hypothetical protein